MFKYMPILRTRNAELSAYQHLSDSRNQLLPLFELTLARRTSRDRDGMIEKNIEYIKNMLDNRWAAIDLTTIPELINRQIDRILADGENGFSLWGDYIKQFESNNIIPSIILDLNNISATNRELDMLNKFSGYTLLRIPISDNPIHILSTFFSNVKSGTEKILLLIDGGFVRVDDSSTRLIHHDVCSQVYTLYSDKFFSLSYSSSSFPKSVVGAGYGDANHGLFDLPETKFISDNTHPFHKCNTFYSDYATLHPLIYPGGAGGWVPRVDLPLDEQLLYYRFRREDGGYVRAAEHICGNDLFCDTGTWGCKEILAAANGAPNGRSPAHWITVRASLHMERQLTRLNSYSGLEL